MPGIRVAGSSDQFSQMDQSGYIWYGYWDVNGNSTTIWEKKKKKPSVIVISGSMCYSRY